jgi:membrane-associated protease RseP (regulator of RpoE activity)
LYGLSISEVKIVESSTEGIRLGDSLLLSLMTKFQFGDLPKGHEVFLNPVAFAGWIGLMITSMNLLPIGQLDGGHIAYAVFGRHQKKVSVLMLIGLIAAGILWWEGWLLWAALSVLFGLRHPPPAYPMIPLSRGRKFDRSSLHACIYCHLYPCASKHPIAPWQLKHCNMLRK